MNNSKPFNNIRTCKRCKDIIHEKALHNYCPKCYKKIEEVFDRIREYLKEYPGATAYEMEQRLGIPVYVVNNFVRDGRLIELPNEFLNIDCLRCGCLLLSAHHKYCPKCEVQIHKELEKAKESLAVYDKNQDALGKMRFRTYTKK
ncbi:hypothetical protein SAMN05660297_00366 [Natronincola peptidivorans]|uniref:Flagellar operon protein TIGR03826 n=1 Tax=Natronincola peptidivorans TaxID=426128 RepID=A0A1H9YRD4_9FIRM|nr:hypothetical protein [Natronincola peptidivorans]SES71650.1 hypothetical protein SAMN05660297_00366 [Natronincola peptidivorans]